MVISERSQMTLEQTRLMHRLPKGVKDPHRQAAPDSQTSNYPSWSPSQEVSSTTSLNNSFQVLITFPCRKFFLSSRLSPSCCPVSPNGWVSFPSPTVGSQGPRVRDRTRTTSVRGSVLLLPHAATVLLGPWRGSDRDHRLQPETAEASLCSPGVPEDPRLPTGCCALCKLCLPGLFPVIYHAP